MISNSALFEHQPSFTGLRHMYLVREIMHCKPGKVKLMVEKFKAMQKLMEKGKGPKMRFMTDMAAERYWTIVSEMEVANLDTFMSMDDMTPEDQKAMGEIMKDYHDLVTDGRREIYKIEG
ncbi:MAG: hypothetical protein ABJB66_06765 [Gemmatimonadaceae bacterium]